MLDRQAIADLYDRHASRLYALALRITGNPDAAGQAVEGAFLELYAAGDIPDPAALLIRATRTSALAQQTQKPPAAVVAEEATPRRLVEDAWYGMSVSDLAAAYGIPEANVRGMLCDGMAQLRHQFVAGTK
jgi:DNA-directed RNA polymerase specialized sigma24 family protein